MNPHDKFKILKRHFGEAFVAQQAGVVDENIDAAPEGLRARDHPPDMFAIGDIGAIRDRNTAQCFDLGCDLERCFGGGAIAADIIDDDFGAARREAQCVAAPEPAARASDDRHAFVESDGHLPPAFAWSDFRT
jgi:hypothetical protein